VPSAASHRPRGRRLEYLQPHPQPGRHKTLDSQQDRQTIGPWDNGLSAQCPAAGVPALPAGHTQQLSNTGGGAGTCSHDAAWTVPVGAAQASLLLLLQAKHASGCRNNLTSVTSSMLLLLS
jgi:hypothetical protein